MPAAQQINLAQWQEHLDFLLPRKELLRADEVAEALGCDERTILRHFDEARLHGHDINAGRQLRQQIRYRRASVVLFLALRANYAPSDLRLRILEVIATQPLPDLVILHQALGELIRRKQS